MEDVKEYKRTLSDHGLESPALQAIFFGLEGASLIGPDAQFNKLVERLRSVTDFGALLQAKVAVFGAPAVRRLENLSPSHAMAVAEPRLAKLESIVRPYGITLAIEPLPAHYGGEFLTSWLETANLVRRLELHYLKLHLDIGCVCLNGDDIGEAIIANRDILAHFHVAEVDLIDLSQPKLPHVDAGFFLRQVGYKGWVSIEMREPKANFFGSLENSLRFCQSAYFGLP